MRPKQIGILKYLLSLYQNNDNVSCRKITWVFDILFCRGMAHWHCEVCTKHRQRHNHRLQHWWIPSQHAMAGVPEGGEPPQVPAILRAALRHLLQRHRRHLVLDLQLWKTKKGTYLYCTKFFYSSQQIEEINHRSIVSHMMTKHVLIKLMIVFFNINIS